MIKNIRRQIKKHPGATALFILYFITWLLMCYLTYYYLVKGEAETIQTVLFYSILCLFIPYLIINIVLAYRGDLRSRKFYRDMAWLIFIPMSMVALVYVAHGIIAYMNKGMG